MAEEENKLQTNKNRTSLFFQSWLWISVFKSVPPLPLQPREPPNEAASSSGHATLQQDVTK